MSTPDAPPNISGAPVPENVYVPQPLPPEVLAAVRPPTDAPTEEPEPLPAIPLPPTRIDLGGTKEHPVFATLKTPDELTGRDSAIAMQGVETGGKWGFADQLIPRIVKSWNVVDQRGRPVKLPSINPAWYDQVSPKVWTALAQAALAFSDVILPDADWGKPSDDPDHPSNA